MEGEESTTYFRKTPPLVAAIMERTVREKMNYLRDSSRGRQLNQGRAKEMSLATSSSISTSRDSCLQRQSVKKARRRDRRKEGRKERLHLRKEAVLKAMTWEGVATMSGNTSHIVMMAKNDHDGAIRLTRFERELSYDDPIFESYKKITGDQSCLIFSCNADAMRADQTVVVMVVKITLFKDMDIQRRERYQWMLDYLQRDV